MISFMRNSKYKDKTKSHSKKQGDRSFAKGDQEMEDEEERSEGMKKRIKTCCAHGPTLHNERGHYVLHTQIKAEIIIFKYLWWQLYNFVNTLKTLKCTLSELYSMWLRRYMQQYWFVLEEPFLKGLISQNMLLMLWSNAQYSIDLVANSIKLVLCFCFERKSHYTVQADPKLMSILSISVSQGLVLQVCATTPGFLIRLLSCMVVSSIFLSYNTVSQSNPDLVKFSLHTKIQQLQAKHGRICLWPQHSERLKQEDFKFHPSPAIQQINDNLKINK